jgi:hypothetical protein
VSKPELYAQKLLGILHQYQGIEARELQLVTDFQIAVSPTATAAEVAAALAKLRDDGLAVRRVDSLRGNVWTITKDGFAEARKLAYESQF